jgi:hypothetical protein
MVDCFCICDRTLGFAFSYHAQVQGEILPTGMSITRAAIQDLMLKKQQAAQASASADAVKNQGSNFGAQN